ncbi:MAG TPA: 1,4-dihydroxy-2-naphthoate polyprenyltransferase [Acidimicrobiales bacterium]|nr:1,4-dihydroxy-2-naphthoate polyprenyltransferase [Acidimicrobiales bacterium]
MPAAVVPVVVGSSAGYLWSGRFVPTPVVLHGRTVLIGPIEHHQLSLVNAFLALIVALSIQVGTNYVNDYADGQRGTDDDRVGPGRLVGGKLATVQQVKIAAAIAFGVAGFAGLILAARVTWWFIPLGGLCVLAGWAYTGGPKPYGYLGFGELFVFLFFGLVATAGSAYVQHAQFIAEFDYKPYNYAYPWTFVLWAGVPVGLLACALLQANNLRDIETDTFSGKKTLAVRLGRQGAGQLYVGTLMAIALSIGVLQHYRGWSLIALAALPLSFYPTRLALSERSGRRLLPLLSATSRLQLAVGGLLAVGFLLVRPG